MKLPWQKSKTNPQRPGQFSFNRLVTWLVTLVTATAADQERAGIFLGGEGRN